MTSTLVTSHVDGLGHRRDAGVPRASRPERARAASAARGAAAPPAPTRSAPGQAEASGSDERGESFQEVPPAERKALRGRHYSPDRESPRPAPRTRVRAGDSGRRRRATCDGSPKKLCCFVLGNSTEFGPPGGPIIEPGRESERARSDAKHATPSATCGRGRFSPSWRRSLPGCNKIKSKQEIKKGNEFLKAAQYQSALAAYEEALRLDPKENKLHKHIGIAYMGMYQPGSKHPKDLEFAEKAIDHLKKYIAAYPEDKKALEYLVSMYLNTERYDDAINFYQNDS